jgi:HSF-type DNA-binding
MGGRIRLPDKLMEFLTKSALPDVLYWREDGKSFAFDTDTVQEKLLDKYFGGSKLASFVRSLNRWGFKRVFCSVAPKHVLCYKHTFFTSDNPEGVQYMNLPIAKSSPRPNESASSRFVSSAADAPRHQINPEISASSVQAAARAPLLIQSPENASAATTMDSSGYLEALKLQASSTSRLLQQPFQRRL